MKQNQLGITLVALVVTIIVLLILAGITITYVIGDNSIIRKAQEAKNTTEQAITNEQNEIGELVNLLKEEYNENNGENEPEIINVGMEIKIEPQNVKTEYLVGEKLTYMITIENTSSIELNNITISCSLEGIEGSLQYININGATLDDSKWALITNLQKGQSKSFIGEYTIQREDVGASVFLNATATTVNPTDTDKVIMAKDRTENAAAIEKEYILTIAYKYATNGNTAASSVIGKYLAGEHFSYLSPEIPGYTANYPVVRSSVDGMPAKDTTITVTYTATVQKSMTPTP